MFAVEAERLLRSGEQSPSGQELAQADEWHRARSQELDSALDRMTGLIGPDKEAVRPAH